MDAKTASTEQMVQYNNYLFVNCWSHQNTILVVDTETDQIVERIEIGAQPSSIVLDRNGKLWALTEGGVGEAPALWRIDAATRSVEQVLSFGISDSPRALQLDGSRERLYYINRDVWQMPVTATNLPAEPLIPSNNALYYSMTVNPVNAEIYIADAIDNVQPGRILRYSPDGNLLDSFTVRIIPGSFCWL
jgi:DNA-binding beta-propeller fold protein YncE